MRSKRPLSRPKVMIDKHGFVLFLLVAIILLGFILRLYRLDTVPFRGDEAFSVQRWAAAPLPISLTEIAAIEPHPPLTYILFRLWGRIFGTHQEFSLRMLPVLFNLIGIPTVYGLGKRLSGSILVGLLAALLWAVHPFQIWHAQDFRNYAIWSGLSPLTFWFGLRTVRLRRSADWAFYFSAALIASLIFYNELITIGVIGLYGWLTCWKHPRFVIRWTLLNTLIIGIVFFAFVILQGDLISSGSYGGTTGGFALSQYWRRFIPVLNFGDTLAITLQQQFDPHVNGWPVILVVTGMTWLIIWQNNRSAALFLVLLGLVPLLMLGLISTRLNIFRPRYVMLAAPAYTIMLSYALLLLWRNHPRYRSMALAALGLWLFTTGISLNNYYHNPAFAKAPDWPALADYLANNTQANEVVIQTGIDPGFGYYFERQGPSTDEFALPIEPDQSEAEIISELAQTSAQYNALWIVGQTFPDWPNAGVVEDWALENLQLVRQTHIADLPVRQFMNWEVEEDEVEVNDTALVSYAEHILLVDVAILTPTPTNDLIVWLYWLPRSKAKQDLTAFVHLVGDENPITGTPLWSQDDHPPQHGRIATSAWESNTMYRDVFVLPLENVINGEYTLQAGLYDPETGERLMTNFGADSYTIGSVQIKK